MPKQTKNYFLYLSGPLSQPVTDSQVINWLEVLQKEGLVFDLLVTNPIFGLKRDWKLQKNKISGFRKKLKGKIYHTFSIRGRNKHDYLSYLLKALTILFLIYKNKAGGKNSSVIIQTRSTYDYNALKLLKFFKPSVNIIMDNRGSGSDEFLNSKGYKTTSEVKDKPILSTYREYVENERKMFTLADHIFCVSNALKQHTIENFPFIKSNNIHVVPGGADDSIFYFDENLRNDLRTSLHIDKKFVIIYSGRLKHFWHKAELIFEYISKLQQKHDSIFFICLTTDLEYAESLNLKYQINSANALIKYVPNSEINSYLCASDAGIILRDYFITNKVSSPTKLPEYLLTGLPIIISDEIGDYSDYIAKHNLGIIVNNQVEEMVESFNFELFTKHNRKSISEKTKMDYSKQSQVTRISIIYNQICKTQAN